MEVDNGTLAANGKTLSASSTTLAALISGGTYDVSSAAQTFKGGLTVQAGGTLTLGTSGGSVNIGSGKALTMDGTLNATSTGATIQVDTSGTYDFWVGSTNEATPTLNITGLAVKNTTANGMRINGNGTSTTTATTTFTNFNNIAFSNGTSGGTLLQIYASSLALWSTGCTFDASTARTVTATGDGFTTGTESTPNARFVRRRHLHGGQLPGDRERRRQRQRRAALDHDRPGRLGGAVHRQWLDRHRRNHRRLPDGRVQLERR